VVSHKIVLCTGDRRYAKFDVILEALKVTKRELHAVIFAHGGAPGADSLVGSACKKLRTPCYSYPAEWQKYRNAAGPIRNRLMLDLHPDAYAVLAFHDRLKDSSGTKDMVEESMRRGLPVILHANGKVTQLQQMDLFGSS
jgi:hypothetical protein